jgi:hypothetical protein
MEKPLKEWMKRHNELIVLSELLGTNLDEESETIKDVLFKDHPALVESFLNGEELIQDDGTVWNPSVHIAFEAMSESLIRNNDQYRNFFQSLRNEGVDSHEARHAVGSVLCELVWHMQHPRGKLYGRTLDKNEIDKLTLQLFGKIRKEYQRY